MPTVLFLPGEAHRRAKLTDDLVRYIRSSPKSTTQLVQELGLSKSLINSVRAGTRWSRVPVVRPDKSLMEQRSRNLNFTRKRLLCEAQVRDIKRNLAIGGRGTKASLARKHGVSHDTIRDIENGFTWGFVTIG